MQRAQQPSAWRRSPAPPAREPGASRRCSRRRPPPASSGRPAGPRAGRRRGCGGSARRGRRTRSRFRPTRSPGRTTVRSALRPDQRRRCAAAATARGRRRSTPGAPSPERVLVSSRRRRARRRRLGAGVVAVEALAHLEVAVADDAEAGRQVDPLRAGRVARRLEAGEHAAARPASG